MSEPVIKFPIQAEMKVVITTGDGESFGTAVISLGFGSFPTEQVIAERIARFEREELADLTGYRLATAEELWDYACLEQSGQKFACPAEYREFAPLEGECLVTAPKTLAEECTSCEPGGVFATDGSGPFDCYECGKSAAAQTDLKTAEHSAAPGLEGAAHPGAKDEDGEAMRLAAEHELVVDYRSGLVGYWSPDQGNVEIFVGPCGTMIDAIRMAVEEITTAQKPA